MTGCATNKALLGQAYTDKAKAEAAQTALQAAEKRVQEARRMPDWPDKCRRHHHSGIVLGDRQSVANKKADNAIGAANDQTDACAALYDAWQKAREPK
ncbi:hypothetical protein NKJ28_00410 [Mesorhizobium sp. M0145]|uniref:hypothetical protein n=1 Tax=Mesorhizobium sp. M0145 TaxID=2956895 RepID=UPI00333C8692